MSADTAFFDQLRFLLAAPPSSAAWDALLAHLNTTPPDLESSALPYAWDHTASWPAAWCDAPKELLAPLLAGKPAPTGLLLCRSWELSWLNADPARMERLLHAARTLRERAAPFAGGRAWGTLSYLHAWSLQAPAGALAALLRDPVAASLEDLFLGENKAGGLGVPFTEALCALPHLRRLSLHWSHIAFAPLRDAPWWPQLEYLRLTRLDLTHAELWHLPAHHLPHLHTLDLTDNPIRAEGAVLLARLDAPLRELVLAGCQLHWRAAYTLVRAPFMEHLHTLQLPRNTLRDRGARAFHRHLPALKHLDLRHNHITDAGAQALQNARHLLPALEQLKVNEDA